MTQQVHRHRYVRLIQYQSLKFHRVIASSCLVTYKVHGLVRQKYNKRVHQRLFSIQKQHHQVRHQRHTVNRQKEGGQHLLEYFDALIVFLGVMQLQYNLKINQQNLHHQQSDKMHHVLHFFYPQQQQIGNQIDVPRLLHHVHVVSLFSIDGHH